MFEAMVEYFEHNLKLVHLNLSGLNLGYRVLDIGPALFKSLTLQAIHLNSNRIREDVRA